MKSGGGRCTLLSVQASDVPLWERGPRCCRLERAGSYFPRVTDVGGESRRGLVRAPQTDHPEWGSASRSQGCLSSHIIPESLWPTPQVYTLSHHRRPILPRCLLPRLRKGGLLALIKGRKMLSSSSPSARLRVIFFALWPRYVFKIGAELGRGFWCVRAEKGHAHQRQRHLTAHD